MGVVANIYAHANEYVETEQSNFPISACLCIGCRISEPMYGEGNHIMTVSATDESGVDVRRGRYFDMQLCMDCVVDSPL